MSDVRPFGSIGCPKCCVLDSQPLLFLSKWVHRAGVASHLWHSGVTYSLRMSIFDFLSKTSFSTNSFFMFFLRIACQNDSQMCPYRNIGSSKMMLCRLFVVFSQTVFLNDPTMIWPHFLKLAAPWKWKTLARKQLKPLWQHIVKKQCPKSHLGAKTTKKRPRLRSKLTTWPRPKILIFHKLHPFATHGHQDRKKQVTGIQFFRKVDKSNPIGTQSCQNQSKLQDLSILWSVSPLGGLPLYIYMYIYIYTYMYICIYI